MELLSPAYGTIFWTTVTFLLLMYVLKKMAWKPILTALDEREKKIKEALQKADLAQKESEEAMAKNQGILDQAKREAQEILGKSRKTAEATKQEIVLKAEEEAANLIEKAKKEIGLEREKAIEELKRQTTDLSLQIASKLIHRSLSAEDHKDIINESLGKFSEAN